ncbi:MAG: hypothetical protein N2515_05325, partial [Deltaproteobacteria bacterium]|nr:hypothetical protein [Deltaproteobacteria bacterium]
EEGLCDAIVCCYGSRIRDYIEVTPQCPTLLILAKHEKSFDTLKFADAIHNKANTSAIVLNASHGFCDPQCPDYNFEAASAADSFIKSFIRKQ